jgi:bifunctional non-homologous end joining protein LigD
MARASSILERGKKRRATEHAQPMPRHIEPMLAVLSDLPSAREEGKYNFEFKWDGVRGLCYYDGSDLCLESRNRLDITIRYPELQAMGRALGRRSVILDGEIVALDDAGRASFTRLQRRMHVNDHHAIARLMKTVPIFYVLFDLLYLDGKWIGDEPYTRRRKLLEEVTVAGPSWQITPAHLGEGQVMLDAARQNHLEGVVAKKLDSAYEPGRRSPGWRKIKIIQRQEFVIGGWIPEGGDDTSRVGAIQIGYHDCDRKLRFAGSVGTGYRAADHEMLVKLFAKHARGSNPFVEKLPKKGVLFLEPKLVAEIEYRRWPEGGLVQQGAYKGLRPDKDARKVVKEVIGGPCNPSSK